MIEIIDRFKDYKNCFQSNLDKSIEEKIDIWENCYILKYPELERKCKEQYESNGYNWRQIAEEMGTKDFFGDWYEVLGVSDVGYFLGSRFIKRLYTKHGIEYIAKMDFAEIKKEVIKYLKLEV